MLKQLVEVSGDELRLPKWGTPDFPRRFEEAAFSHWQVRLGDNVIDRIVKGRVGRLTEPTRDRLAVLFRHSLQGFQADWFQLPLADFRAFVEKAAGARQSYTIYAPSYAPRLDGAATEALKPDELRDWLCGLYISYRYSYEASAYYKVAREVLWVTEFEGRYFFRLWYARGGAALGNSIEEFKGVVLPIGRSLFFTGASQDRGRSLLMRQERNPDSRYCRICIMTSSKVQDDASPVAACTALLKLEEIPENWWLKYCTKKARVVGVDTVDAIIGGDFMLKDAMNEIEGETYQSWLCKFLNNAPLTPADLGQGSIPPKGDSVLRLHLVRFYGHMERIRQEIVKDTRRVAPFKANWRPPPEPRQAASPRK